VGGRKGGREEGRKEGRKTKQEVNNFKLSKIKIMLRGSGAEERNTEAKHRVTKKKKVENK
jgi:hypothetical protein